MTDTLFARLKRYDEGREGFPGEHWFALAAGLFLLGRSRDASPLGRALCLVAGGALVARAASGRDGWVQLLPASHPRRRAADRLGRRRPHQRYVDVAAPWPYDKRVRVSAITEPLGAASAGVR